MRPPAPFPMSPSPRSTGSWWSMRAQLGATAVLRGIRAISDYEHEFQMALMNRRLAPEIETVFLQPAGRYSFVSSRMVKEVFSFGGDVTGLVPPNVLKRLRTDQ